MNKHLLFLACIYLYISHAFADKEFNIYPVGQEKTNWCWAACCEMVYDAYKLEEYGIYGNIDQYDIAEWAVYGDNDKNSLGGEAYSVDEVLWHFGTISCNYTSNPPGDAQGNISKYDLSYEIDQGRPIIAAIVIDNGEIYLHDVLIKGFKGNGGYDVNYVIYNDPENGTREQDTYAQFVRTGNSWAWYETLRLVTNPREPISTGVGPGHAVWIDNGTTEINTSPQNLSYYAFKQGDVPISWEWKLVFPHEDGEAIVASWNVNTSQSAVTWNIPNFILPSYYKWKYSYDGKIRGRVDVICYDPDFHDDAINVVYVPSELYPGILIYEDKTISNPQPDVRVHELLITQNDLFLPGGSISFKSGERIDIKDGITIENGSLCNLIVDPALR